MNDPHDLSRVNEVAEGMMKNYSTKQLARDMAGYHGDDYPHDSKQRKFWQAVYWYIEKRINHDRAN